MFIVAEDPTSSVCEILDGMDVAPPLLPNESSLKLMIASYKSGTIFQIWHNIDKSTTPTYNIPIKCNMYIMLSKEINRIVNLILLMSSLKKCIDHKLPAYVREISLCKHIHLYLSFHSLCTLVISMQNERGGKIMENKCLL